MATYDKKSTQITNADAGTRSDSFLAGGQLQSAIGSCATGSAADAVGSKYRLCRIPSNARVCGLWLQNDALGTSAAVNVGVYYPTDVPSGSGLDSSDATTVIDEDYFASAVSVASAAKPTDIINESGTNTIANQELPLWQAVGLDSDPGIDLDIVATVSTVLAASGSLGLKVDYQV